MENPIERDAQTGRLPGPEDKRKAVCSKNIPSFDLLRSSVGKRDKFTFGIIVFCIPEIIIEPQGAADVVGDAAPQTVGQKEGIGKVERKIDSTGVIQIEVETAYSVSQTGFTDHPGLRFVIFCGQPEMSVTQG